MTESWSGESAEKLFLIKPEIIRDMDFVRRLFADPILCIKHLRQNLMSKSTASEVDSAIVKVLPILLAALIENKYKFSTENIPSEFILLMDTSREEDLETTKAMATVLRNSGVNKNTLTQWVIESHNTEFSVDDEEAQKLFAARLAIINQVYEEEL